MNQANYWLEVLTWQNANEGVKKSQQTEKPTLYIPDFMKNKDHLKEMELHDTDEIAEILKRPRE